MHRKTLTLYAISLLLGIVAGFVSSMFRLSIDGLDALLASLYTFATYRGWPAGLLSAIVSMVMVLASWVAVKYIAPEAGGSGVPEIEGALLHVRPIFWKRLLPVKFIFGILALSAKMVLGREGPTIHIGGNLGEMIGSFFNLSRRRRDTLIAAGAAAGLAAAFNAPLAGVLFVMEEMRNQLNHSFTTFNMVVIACIMSTITLQLIIGEGPTIEMSVYELPALKSLWLFFLFGIIVGFVGLLFNKTLIGTLRLIDKIRPEYKVFYVLAVGLIVGYLAYYHPSAVGGGTHIIHDALTLSPGFNVLCLLIVVRFFATMFCYSTNVPGGIFAPMLALGTLLGLAVFHILEMLDISFLIQPGMFAVAGMAALFAASTRSPITGAVLVVEMTQNYSLIFPLMITCLTSTTVMQLFRNDPVYMQLLKRTLIKEKSQSTCSTILPK